VTEAVERSVTGAIDRATNGREIEATWLDHREGSSPGILVRQGGPHGVGQSREAAALDPCVLEVRLPAGLALVAPPRVWLVGDRLRVELVLTDGPGGIDLYALERCPPRTAPVDVIVGGA
jgi:hypothetical protein